MDHEDITTLLKEVQANQQSLHDDIVVMIDRLAQLEEAVNTLTQHSSEHRAIDEHELYTAARSLVVETGRASTSMLQRVLRIGYGRAAALMDKLEENRIIGPADGIQPQKVLIERDALEELEDEEADGPLHTDNTAELYELAVAAVRKAGKASTSFLQRELRIGYSRAIQLIDMLEERGVISPSEGVAPRKILD